MKREERSAIVLCGGNINYSSLPIATNASNAMIPVNGKPVIGWILDDLIQKEFSKAVIVLQYKNYRLHDFVAWAYTNRIEVQFAYAQAGGSIIDSLEAGLSFATSDSIHLLLGDTLIRDSFEVEDSVYVSAVSDHRKWCMVHFDDNRAVTDYVDKPATQQDSAQALTGYYQFSNRQVLVSSVAFVKSENRRELSSVLRQYGKTNPIKAVEVKQWFDFGNIENFVQSKQRLLQSRHFNSFSIDNTLGVITKRSEQRDKLRNELNWYKQLPVALQVLAPRVIEDESNDGEVNLVQELYGYPNLAELFLFGDLDVDIWKVALDKIMSIHNLFLGYTCSLSPQLMQDMYIEKTASRLAELGSDAEWDIFLKQHEIVINATVYSNVCVLWDSIKVYAEKLSLHSKGSIIHGDFCFSNILYEVNSHLMKVIDPRGSFGEVGIMGDPRYDIAKLRHSIDGLYDYILANLYLLEEHEGSYTLDIYHNEIQPEVATYFDSLISANGYDVKEIKFIEGLLFVSMIPLHKDDRKRQKALYLRGVQLLNEVLK